MKIKFFLFLIGLLAVTTAQADDDFVVYSPHVVRGQSELETRAYAVSDSRPGFAPSNGFLMSLGHTFTDDWKSEIYFVEYQQLPGTGSQLYGHEWENTFQLTQQGQYWLDWGFLASYAQHLLPATADTLEFGPLLEKDIGPWQQRLNIICEKDVGHYASGRYAVRESYALSYKINNYVVPGIEAYYRPADNAHQIGPLFQGELRLPKGKEVEYAFGILKGLNNGAPQTTFIARMEYEFF